MTFDKVIVGKKVETKPTIHHGDRHSSESFESTCAEEARDEARVTRKKPPGLRCLCNELGRTQP